MGHSLGTISPPRDGAAARTCAQKRMFQFVFMETLIFFFFLLEEIRPYKEIKDTFTEFKKADSPKESRIILKTEDQKFHILNDHCTYTYTFEGKVK